MREALMDQTLGCVCFVAGVSRFFLRTSDSRIQSHCDRLDEFKQASKHMQDHGSADSDPPSSIPILLEDPWFFVLNKPVHLLTQAPAGIPNLQSSLVSQLQQPNAPTPFIGIPHRLDRMTSGAVVVARNQRALRRLCDQFAARTVNKIYLAWIYGTPKPSDTLVDSIRKVPDEPRAEVVEENAPGARIASLEYETLLTRSDPNGSAITLVKIRLGTGRMHQIRLQFGCRKHPILGDTLYGSQSPWGTRPDHFREPPMALHAWQIDFHHPKTAERITVTAPVPSEFPWSLP
jgi:RluA family pseudouridine synthase